MKALSDDDPNHKSDQQDHDKKREQDRLSRLKRDFAADKSRLCGLDNLAVRI